MNILKKSETVDIRTEEEMIEYLKTAVKQGFKHIQIEVVNSFNLGRNAFEITVEKP